MLQRLTAVTFLSAIAFATMAQTPAGKSEPEKGWIKQSNEYTNMLLSVQL